MLDIEKDWITKSGLRAIIGICNSPGMGHRCGYVGIPETHPLHGVGDSESDPCLDDLAKSVTGGPIGKRGIISVICGSGENGEVRPSPGACFNVHGSLTYSGGDSKYPVSDDTNRWWFGFDCAHYDDNKPGGQSLEYVIAECESLAMQLSEVKACGQ